MDKFKVGDNVIIVAGPMKNVFGVVIAVNEVSQQYLVRLNGTQQLYFAADQLTAYK